MSLKKLSAVLLSLVLVGGVLTGCGDNSGGGGSSGNTAKPRKPAPPLDKERIAADEARGIRFSADKRTLVKYNKDLPDKEYTIPTGVTTIGNMAFAGCDKLTSVTIPASVESIGDAAFCIMLGKVEVSPENPNFYIDASGALIDRGNRRLIYFPPRFSGAYAIPDGVRTIGMGAFAGCKNLTKVTIPNSVTTIGNMAFAECKKIEVAPDNRNFYTDASGALIDRGNRRLIYFPHRFAGAYAIPSGVTTIGDGAFFQCTNLMSVTIPSSVTIIGEKAFAGCENLTKVTIPSSVTTIGEGAFAGCKKIEVAPDNRNFYTDASGALIDRGNKKLLFVPPDISGAYAIPSGVTTIGNRAFDGCESLTGVTIPPSVTTIGDLAFFQCSNLTSVTIPPSVTTIGNGAFQWCHKLTSVTIPSSVTTIGNGAFAGCENLTSVTIPPSVTIIGDGAFFMCSNLTSVTIQPGVKTIGEMAFFMCSNLTSVTIPPSVKTIGARAFSGCYKLARVTIPPSVTTIGERAFSGCPCEAAVKRQFPNYGK